MGVHFAAEARRLILAATALAETRGRPRPHIRDLADAMLSTGLTLPPFPIDALNDDSESVLGSAAQLAGTGEVTVAMLLGALAGPAHRAEPVEVWSADDATASLVPPASFRVGIGYDSHRFAAGGPMVLGGIRIASEVHCAGHSDGDAICHALADAVLGAANCGDIGQLFPDTDAANAGRDSAEMLRTACAMVRAQGLRVLNADVTVIAEGPKIGPHRTEMRRALAEALGVDAAMISVKGKTNEGMGWIGRAEGLAVIAVAGLAPAPH